MAEILSSFDVCLFACLCVCVCVCADCAQRSGQSDQFKTVKATDFKFDMHVPRDSPTTSSKSSKNRLNRQTN